MISTARGPGTRSISCRSSNLLNCTSTGTPNADQSRTGCSRRSGMPAGRRPGTRSNRENQGKTPAVNDGPEIINACCLRCNKRSYHSPRNVPGLSCRVKMSSRGQLGLSRRFGTPRRFCLRCPDHGLPSCFCCHSIDCCKEDIQFFATPCTSLIR